MVCKTREKGLIKQFRQTIISLKIARSQVGNSDNVILVCFESVFSNYS